MVAALDSRYLRFLAHLGCPQGGQIAYWKVASLSVPIALFHFLFRLAQAVWVIALLAG